MFTHRVRLAVVTASVVSAMLMAAAPSYAIFPYYDFRTRSWTRTNFPPVAVVQPVVAVAPVAVAPGYPPPCSTCPTAACSPCATTACSPCATTACSPCETACTACSPVVAYSPVVNYVAETAYRLQTVNTPVTSYIPMATCDAWGQPAVAYSPVTSYVSQVQQVPFTTYRPVISYSPVAAPACATGSACSTCPTGGCATGNCPSGACDTGIATAAAPAGEAAPRLMPVLPPTTNPSATTPDPNAPSLPAPVDATPSPYGPSAHLMNPKSTTRPSSDSPLRNRAELKEPAPLVPLKDINDSGSKPTAPLLLDPNDKTASLDHGNGRDVSPALWLSSGTSGSETVQDSGWHAARR